jgi:hypothetical protein
MKRLRAPLSLGLVASLTLATAATPAGNGHSVQAADLKRWLSYLASDELEGRATFTEGLGLAAAFIAQELKANGVQPGGDNGSYFQRVRVLGVKSANRSTLTVEVDGRSRTFKEGDTGVAFPRNVGGKRRLVLDQVEFVGYGLDAPVAKHNDYTGKDVRGKAVVWLGAQGPEAVDARTYRRLLSGRHRYATEQMQAAASIGPELPRFGRGGQQAEARPDPDAPPAPAPAPTPSPTAAPAAGAGGFGFAPLPTPDFTTAQRLDKAIPPNVTGKDELFEFLFSAAPQRYAELKDKVAKRAPLPSFRLPNVKLTFDIDADYEVVRTQFTRNVVGVVPGSDAAKRESYVAFGAHYDHVGYAEGEVAKTGQAASRRLGAPGRVKEGALDDRIWNGADDDGSGSATLLGIAKAAAAGPRPKRSLVFIWHTGEERGLWGSRYFADYPGVPAEKIVAQLNMDMVGRNRDDKAEESNTVYLVGSDRISTELHNLNEETNAKQPRPLKLDYEMNDPADLEQVYYRSDHFSYAAYGIPIIFYTTGLHPDYHVNTDSVEKIEFEKMARIGQLVLDTGLRVANLDHAPARDNKGPRAGKGFAGKLR